MMSIEFNGIAQRIDSCAKGERVVIAADKKVWLLYGKKLKEALEKRDLVVSSFVVPQGEEAKNREVWYGLLGFLEGEGITREDTLIGLGGGTTGDLAAFAASTYMRGMGYIAVPTTLLAMVDSSIGGKCGINMEQGKNLAGTFREADLVITEPGFLDTLPDRELRSGLGEVMKYAVMGSESLFEILEKQGSIEEIMKEHGDRIIQQCISMKKTIIEKDLYDRGERKKLNLGHTPAHAAEVLSGYSIGHGSAVATGICHMARFSFERGYCTEHTCRRIENLAQHLGFDSEFPYSRQQLIQAASSDKKRHGDGIDLVIIEDIGKCTIRTFTYDGREKVQAKAPPSKSMAHRALICSWLGNLDQPDNLGRSDDVWATQVVLRGMIHARNAGKPPYHFILESGSTLRFTMPVSALKFQHSAWILGEGLARRPMDPLIHQMYRNGVNTYRTKDVDPSIDYVQEGMLQPGKYEFEGNTTSQFISGLLMALPMLNGDSIIQVNGRLQSEPYVNMTLQVMADYGVTDIERIEEEGKILYKVKGNQSYVRQKPYKVEGDWSGTAFLMAATALSGRSLRITGLNRDSLQGDKRIMEILPDFGIDTAYKRRAVEIYPYNRDKVKENRVYDVSDIPDLAPVIAVMAAIVHGKTTVTGGERLKLKETDRIESICCNLKQAGVMVEVRENGFVIKGGSPLKGGEFDGRKDHRIYMMLAVMSLFTEDKVILENAEKHVSKSWPDFFTQLHKARLDYNLELRKREEDNRWHRTTERI